jgi:hypothetical protein
MFEKSGSWYKPMKNKNKKFTPTCLWEHKHLPNQVFLMLNMDCMHYNI